MEFMPTGKVRSIYDNNILQRRLKEYNSTEWKDLIEETDKKLWC